MGSARVFPVTRNETDGSGRGLGEAAGRRNVRPSFSSGTTNQTKDGSVVRKCRVADKTGSVCFSLWNEQAEAIEEGDILRLVRGYDAIAPHRAHVTVLYYTVNVRSVGMRPCGKAS